MKNFKNIARFIKDDSGATAIEYALIAGIISLGLVTAATGLKDEIVGEFGAMETKIENIVQ